jgi:hypothetical protein
VRAVFRRQGPSDGLTQFNTDLGGALERAEDPFYPLDYSRFASELFLNTIIYALSY